MEQTAITVSGLLTDVGSVLNSAIETMASNPLLAVFLGLGLLTAGAAAFRKLRKSSK